MSRERLPWARAASLVLGLMLASGLALGPRPALAATEWVLILDNSASMGSGGQLQEGGTVQTLPPTDPDRLSVLATLIFRALLDRSDRLTVLTFQGGGIGRYRELPNNPDAIRHLAFDQSTPFTGPLRRARAILTSSQLPARTLLLVTDGAPSNDDPLTAAQARALLGLESGPPVFEVISLGLTGGSEKMAELQRAFLGPLGGLSRIDSARELVRSFTEVFAAQIRSRPLSGRLESGGSFTFSAGRYVTEVLVDMASEGRTGPFSASLTADGGAGGATEESGDNGCAAPPCHTYKVLKAPHDPGRASRFTLHLERSSGPVAYGVILRYDLSAEIVQAPASTRIGDEIEVAARLVWQNKTFDDRAFFDSDGFQATLLLGADRVPLQRRGDGTFAGRIKIATLGTQKLRARFANHWLDLSAAADLRVEGYVPLALRLSPDPIDFGSWRGDRTATERCADLNLSGSQNAGLVPLEALAQGLPEGVSLQGASPLVLAGATAQVCLRVRGCCGDLDASPSARLLVRGRDPHYHPDAASARLAFHVERTSFLTCWWRVLAAAAGGALLLFIVTGFVRPLDFDAEEVIRLARTEPALGRAAARRLRELPGGRRGFYRDAYVAFDGSGNPAQSRKGAALTFRADRADPLVTARQTVEVKDPRTHKWEPLPGSPGQAAIRRSIVYRCGDFYFRLG